MNTDNNAEAPDNGAQSAAASPEVPRWYAYAVEQVDAEALKFVNHTASLDEWITQIETHLVRLKAMLAQQQPADWETAARDVVFLDILIATENERAALKAVGESEIYENAVEVDPHDSHLELKRFACVDELAEFISDLHKNLTEEDEETTRVILPVTDSSHFVAAEMRTVMEYEGPHTAIVCLDSTNSGAANHIKQKFDETGLSNVDFVVFNTGTEQSLHDCPMYSVFHALKMHSLERKGTFKGVIDDLFDGGKPGGSKKIESENSETNAYLVRDDNKSASRVLPPEILKETQKGDRLRGTMQKRGWNEQTPANKKGESLLDRDRRYREGFPWSSSMAQKRIKYFERALEFVKLIKAGYEPEHAQQVLNDKLMDTRFYVPPRAVHHNEVAVVTTLFRPNNVIDFFETHKLYAAGMFKEYADSNGCLSFQEDPHTPIRKVDISAELRILRELGIENTEEPLKIEQSESTKPPRRILLRPEKEIEFWKNHKLYAAGWFIDCVDNKGFLRFREGPNKPIHSIDVSAELTQLHALGIDTAKERFSTIVSFVNQVDEIPPPKESLPDAMPDDLEEIKKSTDKAHATNEYGHDPNDNTNRWDIVEPVARRQAREQTKDTQHQLWTDLNLEETQPAVKRTAIEFMKISGTILEVTDDAIIVHATLPRKKGLRLLDVALTVPNNLLPDDAKYKAGDKVEFIARARKIAPNTAAPEESHPKKLKR